MIFFAGNCTVFCDSCTIVIRCVATTLAQIAPISTAVGHVDVKYGDAVTEIVLEEHPGEVRVDQSRTAIQARTSPRVNCTTLKLRNGVGRVPALVEVSLTEIGGKARLSPVGWIGAIPAARIIVMSIDIRAAWFARDKQTDSCGFIVDCICQRVICSYG